jgi:hypothetical protein
LRNGRDIEIFTFGDGVKRCLFTWWTSPSEVHGFQINGNGIDSSLWYFNASLIIVIGELCIAISFFDVSRGGCDKRDP